LISDQQLEQTPTSNATTLREWLAEKPFAMTMSSGFFGFFAHCGVMSVLEEENLLPTRASGSSAGALVVGCWAGGVPAQELRDELLALQRKDFWDPGFGWGLLKGELFRKRLLSILPVETFAECRIPLAVSAYDLKTRSTQVLNEGPLHLAIQASCAFPFMFQPVRIQKNRYLDGGIADRPGLMGMPKDERLFFHHLASKSPWRRKNSKDLKIPKRDNMVSMVIGELPRVNPFRLERGVQAFNIAREATQVALDSPIENDQVMVFPGQYLPTSPSK